MIDWVGEVICDTQGMIYEYGAQHLYNMEEFSEKYMKSSFCKRSMDADYSRFQFADPEECLDFILPEIGEFEGTSNGKMYDVDICQWIGWTYRYIAYSSGIASEEIVSKLPFNLMVLMYPGYHTIDEEQAYEIIMENHFHDHIHQKETGA